MPRRAIAVPFAAYTLVDKEGVRYAVRGGHPDDAGPLPAMGPEAEVPHRLDPGDPDQRAEYQGAAHIGHTAGSVWAPALFTWLAMEHGTTGWLVIAA